MSPQARTGLLAVALVGGLFLVLGSIVGAIALASRTDTPDSTNAVSPSYGTSGTPGYRNQSGSKADSAPSPRRANSPKKDLSGPLSAGPGKSAITGSTPVGAEITVAGVLETIFPQCPEAFDNLIPGRVPAPLPKSFALALVVKTKGGEYTCLVPACTPAELDRVYRPLEGRTVAVRGTLISSEGVCREMFNCRLIR
jgi:hypothetical protein